MYENEPLSISMARKVDYRGAKLYFMAFISSLGAVNWGYNLTVINSIHDYLELHLFPGASALSIALIHALPTLGAAVASYLCGSLLDRFGRRGLLIIADFIAIAGSVLSLFDVLPVLILGRALVGLSIGLNNVTIPLYNVEIAATEIKGIIGAMFMMMLAFGQFLGLAVQFLMKLEASQMWRILLAVPIIFCIIRLIVFTMYLPFETPFHLVLKGKLQEAKQVLGVIYTDNIDLHLSQVMKDKEASTSNGNLTLRDMFTSKYLKAFVVGNYIYISLHLCGFGPIFLFFNEFIKGSAGGDVVTMSIFSTLMGLVSFTFTCVAAFHIEKFGRRNLLIKGMSMLLIWTVLFAVVGYIGGASHPSLKYILILWPAFYRLSIGTIAPIYISELLPGAGCAFATFVSWSVGFIMSEFFPLMVKAVGIQGVMLTFGGFALLCIIISNKVMIESKGRTKAELLTMYATGKTVINEESTDDTQSLII